MRRRPPRGGARRRRTSAAPARTASGSIAARERRRPPPPSRCGGCAAPRSAELLDAEQRLVGPPQLPGAVGELGLRPVAEAHAPRAAAEVLDPEPERRDRDVVVALVGEDPQLGRRGRPRSVPWRSRWSGARLSSTARLGRERERCPRAGRRTPRRRRSRRRVSSPTSERQRRADVAGDRDRHARPRGGCGRCSSVVVVLPFVPVTAMNSLRRAAARRARARPATGSPRSRAAATPAPRAARPGDLTTARDALEQLRAVPSGAVDARRASLSARPARRRRRRPPARRARAAPERGGDARSARGPTHEVRARRASGGRARASRDRLLVDREADRRADRGDDPEAQDDLRLRPAEHLEVVVDRAP